MNITWNHRDRLGRPLFPDGEAECRLEVASGKARHVIASEDREADRTADVLLQVIEARYATATGLFPPRMPLVGWSGTLRQAGCGQVVPFLSLLDLAREPYWVPEPDIEAFLSGHGLPEAVEALLRADGRRRGYRAHPARG